ncbi:hypothetical protein HAP48_0042670 [Bradyrhizobium septentrionale]|uniref:Uncharacterized protein n=1 Tax=Bradyrhizobium septentrionale TaxID=1404411 RepID=A0A973W2M2_9BRAD|nr:hypothetical protein [Bradyrhizobium septentrionale]UGY15162.1 hypothetical protein HAP48_0042670 [Bradyrhizobium septentrionale]
MNDVKVGDRVTLKFLRLGDPRPDARRATVLSIHSSRIGVDYAKVRTDCGVECLAFLHELDR